MSNPSGRRPALLATLLLVACTAPNPLFEGPRPQDAAEEPARDAAPPAPDRAVSDRAASVPDTGAEGAAGPAALGAACTGPAGCLSGFCVDGVCCESACRERCRSCGLAGSLGTCTLIPAGADPRDECLAQEPSTCGRAGGCDGQGECQLHPAGTECRARSCAAGVELGASLCDGRGTCGPGGPTACTLGDCAGDRCAVGCTTSCPNGFQCLSGRCAGAPPALHWRFDEASGAAAVDASTNALNGSYRGDGALPTPSTSVPRTSFPDPRSRDFGPGGNPGVLLTPVPEVLRPARTVTVSLWYRATSAAPSGSDLMTLGDDYFIRLKVDDIEFAKRRSDVPGMLYQLATARDLADHLDGKWHHLAGVISAASVELYYDGRLRVSRANSDPILYRGTALWAGRDAEASRPFRGGLDDLRIYTRDLSLAEIQKLAAGGEP